MGGCLRRHELIASVPPGAQYTRVHLGTCSGLLSPCGALGARAAHLASQGDVCAWRACAHARSLGALRGTWTPGSQGHKCLLQCFCQQLLTGLLVSSALPPRGACHPSPAGGAAASSAPPSPALGSWDGVRGP